MDAFVLFGHRWPVISVRIHDRLARQWAGPPSDQDLLAILVCKLNANLSLPLLPEV